MTRRRRAILFAAAAALCAGAAASVAGGYRASVADQLGVLRPVVVATAELPAGRPLRPQAVGRTLEVKRIPERFVPVDAIASPTEAIGRAPAVPIPAGSYLLAAQFRVERPRPRRPQRPVPSGRAPVELTISAAAALAELEPRPRRVDVVVTTETGLGGRPGRTYVAAEDVALLGLRAGAPGGDALAAPRDGTWTATLALTREQALRLINAEAFARQLRLIPS